MSAELIDAIIRFVDATECEDGIFATPVDAFRLIRFAQETTTRPVIYKPALCVVVQGEKHVLVGERSFDYGAMQAMVISVEMPAFSRARKASPLKPYLGVTFDLDLGVMREIMGQIDTPSPAKEVRAGVFVIDMADALADCVLRLARLLATPRALPVLYPAIMREMYYWLLTGPHGSEIRRLASPDGHTQRIAQAIARLRENYHQPMRVKQLAEAARMSPSTFHHHFKTLTSMSPLQYQKQLRLLEARRLMMEGAANVETAAYSVGYESASQFSREYARRFGTSPKRDVARMKQFAA
jgi:AraC-like DNA-binding protein